MKRFLLLITLFTATFQMTFAQRVPVSVVVTDETGSGLPGANVLIKGTTDGGITDANGKLTLNATPDAVIQISSIGYTTKEITVGNQTIINHQMVLDVTQLSEVVVTGYASEQRKDIVGSVSVVKTADLLATPSGSVTNQLQGRSAGVTVNASGSPGGGAKVRIRGFGSFSGGGDPLYIIDGVPATTNGDNTSSPIDNLNPNDIESLQVLKDAAAASIYGARAANGVVIVTTKQGKVGSAKISVDSYYATNYFSKSNFPDMLNTQEYGDMYFQSMRGAGLVPGGTGWGHAQYGNGANPVTPEYIYVLNNGAKLGGRDLEALRGTNPAAFNALVDPSAYNFKTHQIVKAANTDWFDEVFNPAPQQSHQISATGGSEQGTYALSLNYYDQQNTTSEYGFYQRYTMRANSTFKIKKNIRIGENVQVGYNRNRDGASTSATWTMQSILPVYDIMGNPASSAAPAVVEVGDTGRNPITEAYRNRFDKQNNYLIFGNVFGEVDIVKGLTARTSFGLDYSTRNNSNFTPVTYEHAENTGISGQNLQVSANTATTWTWTNTLAYGRTFAEKHNFKVLVGTEAIQTYSTTLQATRTSSNTTVPAYALEEDPDFLTISAGVGNQTNSGAFARNALYSLFGRLDYSYSEKYLFNATLRRDVSSKFGPNNRVGIFPAAAVGWRLSSEEFLKGVSWVSDLKLRASYGVIGNQSGLPNDNRYTVYQQSLGEGYPIAGGNTSTSNSYIINSLGNPDAKWERNITTNVGVDASLFNNSLDITAEYYVKRTDGLLVRNQPPYTGFSGTQPYINAGDMTNKGIDLGITKRGNIIDGLRYEVGLTFTHYKNNVEKVLDNPLSTLPGGGTRFGNVPSLTAVGRPMSQFYGYETDGFFNTQEEVDAYKAQFDPTGATTPWIPPAVGRWKIKDQNGDNLINDSDRTFIGSPHPDFQAGFNVTLGYKNFDLTAFLFWNQGGKILNYSRYNTDFNTFKYNRSARMLYDSWTPDHTDALLPKLDILDTYSNKYLTDYFIEDATYVRLKTLQLGFNFPRTLLEKVKLDRLRLYAQATNLFTITKFSGLDPDSGLSGDDLTMGIVNNITPVPKQILFGINIGF